MAPRFWKEKNYDGVLKTLARPETCEPYLRHSNQTEYLVYGQNMWPEHKNVYVQEIKGDTFVLRNYSSFFPKFRAWVNRQQTGFVQYNVILNATLKSGKLLSKNRSTNQPNSRPSKHFFYFCKGNFSFT